MGNTISTKLGTFNVESNGNGGSSLFIGNSKIAEFSCVEWWNKDLLEEAITANEETIRCRIEERVNNNHTAPTREDAIQVLEEMLEVLGDEEKGFYKSRLKQCINKLKSVA